MLDKFRSKLRRGKFRAKVPYYQVLISVVCLVFTLVFSSVTVFNSFSEPKSDSSYLAAVLPSILVDLTNADREKEGLSSLSVDLKLQKAAELKAKDMAENGYFSHVSPSGVSPWHWLDIAGYDYSEAGENLAVHFDDSSDVNSAWMNSPSHRANIVRAGFTEIGIGTAEGMFEGRPTVFVVQFFGRPDVSPSVVVLDTAPTPKEVNEAPLKEVNPSLEEVNSVAGATTGQEGGAVLPESGAIIEEPAMPVLTAIEPSLEPSSGDNTRHSRLSVPRRSASDSIRLFGAVIALLAAVVAAPLAFSMHGHAHHGKMVHIGTGLFIALLVIGTYFVFRTNSTPSGKITDSAAIITLIND